jgi:hypothetical protein
VSLETNFSAGQAAFSLGVKQIVLKEIRSKWSKFAKDDLSGLKNKDDLATRRAAKYGLEKSATRRDVDALMSGRQILPERAMTTLDYNAPAELFPPRLRKSPNRRFGYRRFARAGDAVRFAIEELPPELLLGAVLEVDGERYCGEDIRRLYDRADFPSLPQAAHPQHPHCLPGALSRELNFGRAKIGR